MIYLLTLNIGSESSFACRNSTVPPANSLPYYEIITDNMTEGEAESRCRSIEAELFISRRANILSDPET